MREQPCPNGHVGNHRIIKQEIVVSGGKAITNGLRVWHEPKFYSLESTLECVTCKIWFTVSEPRRSTNENV